VPEGFTVEIASTSAPDIISETGKITIPEYDTVVNVVLKVTRVSDEKVAYTSPIPVLVQGMKEISDIPYTVTAVGGLDRTAGIKATARIVLNHGHTNPEGQKVVTFRLMKGDRVIRTYTRTSDISPGDEISVYFNVYDPNNACTVRVFVYDSDLSPLANPIIIN